MPRRSAPEKTDSSDTIGSGLRAWGFTDDTCFKCFKHNSEIDSMLLQCGKCKKAYYCSMKCFNADLSNHREYCNTGKVYSQPTGRPLPPLPAEPPKPETHRRANRKGTTTRVTRDTERATTQSVSSSSSSSSSSDSASSASSSSSANETDSSDDRRRRAVNQVVKPPSPVPAIVDSESSEEEDVSDLEEEEDVRKASGARKVQQTWPVTSPKRLAVQPNTMSPLTANEQAKVQLRHVESDDSDSSWSEEESFPADSSALVSDSESETEVVEVSKGVYEGTAEMSESSDEESEELPKRQLSVHAHDDLPPLEPMASEHVTLRRTEHDGDSLAERSFASSNQEVRHHFDSSSGEWEEDDSSDGDSGYYVESDEEEKEEADVARKMGTIDAARNRYMGEAGHNTAQGYRPHHREKVWLRKASQFEDNSEPLQPEWTGRCPLRQTSWGRRLMSQGSLRDALNQDALYEREFSLDDFNYCIVIPKKVIERETPDWARNAPLRTTSRNEKLREKGYWTNAVRDKELEKPEWSRKTPLRTTSKGTRLLRQGSLRRVRRPEDGALVPLEDAVDVTAKSDKSMRQKLRRTAKGLRLERGKSLRKAEALKLQKAARDTSSTPSVPRSRSNSSEDSGSQRPPRLSREGSRRSSRRAVLRTTSKGQKLMRGMSLRKEEALKLQMAAKKLVGPN